MNSHERTSSGAYRRSSCSPMPGPSITFELALRHPGRAVRAAGYPLGQRTGWCDTHCYGGRDCTGTSPSHRDQRLQARIVAVGTERRRLARNRYDGTTVPATDVESDARPAPGECDGLRQQ